MERSVILAAARRLRAATSELTNNDAAGEACARMAYLLAWSTRLGRVLDQADLEEAIWSFWTEYPKGALGLRNAPHDPA